MAMAYTDPIDPQVNLSDFLHIQTLELNAQTVAYASGTATAPNPRQLRWVLPPVGLLSRVYLDVDGGSSTAFDFTAGGGTGTAVGRGPWSIIENLSIRINGGVAIFDVSGFGTFLLEAAEEPASLPATQGAGAVYTTAPLDVENTIYNYPATADGRPRFGFSIPLSLTPGNPLGMILAGNDQTTIELVATFAALSEYSTLAGGASATLTLTATPNVEFFAVPEPGAFAQYVRPVLGWAHQNRETRQNITATGAQEISLDNHDTILQLIHTVTLNSVLNTDAIERLRFVLNRTEYRFDHGLATHLRKQRRAIGKDLPAFVWTFFQTRTLRDAIRADSFTDIRSILTVASGTTIGTAYVDTCERKLIQLDRRAV